MEFGTTSFKHPFGIRKYNIYSPEYYTCETEYVSRSIMSSSLQPRGLWPARLLCPWNSPGKNTGVGIHSLLWGIFPASNPGLLHCKQILYHLNHQGSPIIPIMMVYRIVTLLDIIA